MYSTKTNRKFSLVNNTNRIEHIAGVLVCMFAKGWVNASAFTDDAKMRLIYVHMYVCICVRASFRLNKRVNKIKIRF